MKIEGTQNIPSELEILYSAALTKKGANTYLKKRSPFRLPKMQAGQPGVTTNQQRWRDRFKDVADRFKNEPQATKARWFNALPVELTDIGYYNFYVLSSYNFALTKFLEVSGVIKSIQFAEDIIPVSGGKTFTINAVDTTKTIVVPLGNSFLADKIYRGQGTLEDGSETTVSIGATIDTNIADVKISGWRQKGILAGGDGEIDGYNAILASLSDVNLVVKAPYVAEFTQLSYCWEIIEKKGRVVFPIVKEINQTSIVIDWSEEPTYANRVSIQVIEYI